MNEKSLMQLDLTEPRVAGAEADRLVEQLENVGSADQAPSSPFVASGAAKCTPKPPA